jgi:hypothetical protein
MEPYIKLEPIFSLEFKTTTNLNGTFFQIGTKNRIKSTERVLI